MVKVVLVDKNANIKETLVKNFQEENLYKKCNFRNSNNFGKVNTFELTFEGKKIYISVYAKNSGRANTENKYELPPPIDKELYFGNIIVLKHKEKEITALTVENLTKLEWDKIYEQMFGGFDDLDEEEEESEDEEIPAEFLTKEGYSKEDGFVVDDDDDEDIEIEIDDDGEEEEEEEEEEDYVPSNETEDEEEEEEEEDDEEYSDEDSDIGSELSEESYVSEVEENA
jgi:hypothetical protein